MARARPHHTFDEEALRTGADELSRLITESGVSLRDLCEEVPSGKRITGLLVERALKAVYRTCQHPSPLQKECLARLLNMSVDKVTYWFGNVRSKNTRKRTIEQIIIQNEKRARTGAEPEQKKAQLALTALSRHDHRRKHLARKKAMVREVQQTFAPPPVLAAASVSDHAEAERATSAVLHASMLTHCGLVSEAAIRDCLSRVADEIRALA